MIIVTSIVLGELSSQECQAIFKLGVFIGILLENFHGK